MLAARDTRVPAILLVLFALLAVTAFAGCSGEDEDASEVISETFSKQKRINSGKLSLDLSADVEGVPQLSGPLTLKVSGPFETPEDGFPKLDLDLTAGGAGQSFQGGAVSTGEKGFLTFQGTDYVIPDSQFARIKREVEQAQKENDDSKQPSLGALGVQPREWLKDPKNEGTEDIAGAEAIHIAADVDVAKLLDDIDGLLKRAGQLGLSEQQQQQLPEAIPPTVKKQIVDSVNEAKLDLYTGKDDKILRRVELSLKFEIPEDVRSEFQGLKSGRIDFKFEIADVNEPQTIEEPEKAKPLRELQRQFSGELGGLGGGSSGSGSSGGGGGSGSGSSGSGDSSGGGGGSSGSSNDATPGGSNELDTGGGLGNVDTDAARRYLRCVERAQGTSKLRECAELLK
jgi:hypothetical protein